jgi:hypothetical protein
LSRSSCARGVCDRDGRTYAMAAIKTDQLMLLHHEPFHRAA